MEPHKITFQPQNRTVVVAHGESLIRAAMEAGVHINASCGGEGVCGKCRVIIEEGEVEGGVSERLKPEDREKGYRLACLAPAIVTCVKRRSGVSHLNQRKRRNRLWIRIK